MSGRVGGGEEATHTGGRGGLLWSGWWEEKPRVVEGRRASDDGGVVGWGGVESGPSRGMGNYNTLRSLLVCPHRPPPLQPPQTSPLPHPHPPLLAVAKGHPLPDHLLISARAVHHGVTVSRQITAYQASTHRRVSSIRLNVGGHHTTFSPLFFAFVAEQHCGVGKKAADFRTSLH